MFGHLLVPLDGSSLAECVLPHVAAFARFANARVTLVRVLELPTLAGRRQPTDSVQWQLAANEAEEYLFDVRSRLGELVDIDKIETRVLEGDPARILIEYARSEAVDLVVLSSHGWSGPSGPNLGTAAYKIALHVNTSFLIVRAFTSSKALGAPHGYQRLLLPLDGSRRAECVLPTASLIAEQDDCTVVLAHVIERKPSTNRLPLLPDEEEMVEDYVTMRRNHAGRYLATLRSELTSVIRDVQTRLDVAADPVACLHDVADAEGADLVVMSAHGDSVSTRWPLGRTVMNVLVYGGAPLLVVQDLPRHEIEPSIAQRSDPGPPGHG